MGLEKPVELVAGGESQQAAQGVLSQMPALVFLQPESFQGAARKIAACSAELAGEIIGNFNGSDS